MLTRGCDSNATVIYNVCYIFIATHNLHYFFFKHKNTMRQLSTDMYENNNNNKQLTGHKKGWGKAARMTP